TYSCPECFPAMTVTDVADTATQAVPEPGFGAGLAAGLAGLLALGRRRRGVNRFTAPPAIIPQNGARTNPWHSQERSPENG
ncbi:MAG: PEP-CTERM sorting domain-containing protein, partial [Myxococcota bacterium]|nr:PEP-CTERM sorting domain-containing protein [Myxococcota bacterium]